MKQMLIIFFIVSRTCAFSQNSQGQLHTYFDTAKYYSVDSVFFSNGRESCAVYVFFETSSDESVLIYRHGKTVSSYSSFLTCYSCQGRGSDDATYGGHCKKGNTLVFMQDTFDGRDSVFVDFSGSVPYVQQVVRRSYTPNDKIRGSDDHGNYLFIAKDPLSTPISDFKLPLDRVDQKVRSKFNIKSLKWIKPNWF